MNERIGWCACLNKWVDEVRGEGVVMGDSETYIGDHDEIKI